MKRLLHLLPPLCLAVLLLTTSALADVGPEHQLTVRVVNAPEEPYYLDLLFPGNYESQISHAVSYPGLDWNYTPEEIAALDQDLLDALRSTVPEGWCAAVAEGGNAPIRSKLSAGGKDTDGNPFHPFSGMLPDTYRLLLVTESGETFLSDTHSRRTLQAKCFIRENQCSL